MSVLLCLLIMFLDYLMLILIAKGSGHLSKDARMSSITTYLLYIPYIVTDDANKANTLSNQFASVFTREDVPSLPPVSGTSFADMNDIRMD